jgi:hypothetical protein
MCFQQLKEVLRHFLPFFFMTPLDRIQPNYSIFNDIDFNKFLVVHD